MFKSILKFYNAYLEVQIKDLHIHNLSLQIQDLDLQIQSENQEQRPQNINMSINKGQNREHPRGKDFDGFGGLWGEGIWGNPSLVKMQRNTKEKPVKKIENQRKTSQHTYPLVLFSFSLC